MDTFAPGTRKRNVDEIIPVLAEQSLSAINNEGNGTSSYLASNAIDLNFNTLSKAVASANKGIWLKLTLDQVYCVEKVIRYERSGDILMKYTCSEGGCKPGYSITTVTVYTEDPSLIVSMPPKLACVYGNRVKLEKHKGSTLTASEISIIGRKGRYN